jgi:hypothetical protein
MGAETHIEDPYSHIHIPVINVDSLFPHKYLVTHSARLAIAGYNEGVLFIARPFLKDL